MIRKLRHIQPTSYGIALLADAIAFLLTWVLQPLLTPTVFALFYPAIMISSLYGGLGPGLFATVLGGLLTQQFFLSLTNTGEVFRFLVFCLVGLMISVLSSRYRSAKLQAEKTAFQLRESQDLFESFMRNSPMTAFIKDEAGRYLYVNPLAERLFDRPLEHWLSRTDFDLYPAELAQQLRQNDQEVLTTGRVVEAMEIEPRADGDRYFMSLRFPVVNRSGEKLLAGMSLDLTEYKRTENALRESESRFRQMAETIQDVFWITDFRVPQILYVSPAYEKIWGRPRDELYQDYTHWIETIYPEDRQHTQAIAQSCQNDDFVINEYRIVRPDGSLRWIRDRGFALRNETGEIYQVVGIAQDVTDYKLALDALKHSEAKFRRLVEGNIFGLAIGDFNGNMSYANDALLTMIGYSRQELESGQIRWVDLTPPDQLELDWKAGEELRQRGVCQPFEKTYIHKDGHRVPILIGAVLLDQTNQPSNQMIAFYLDLTERVRVESALRESEERFRTLANSVPVWIWVNGLDGRCEFVNKEYLEFLGKPLDEVVGFGWSTELHPDDQEPYVAAYLAALTKRQPFRAQFRAKRFDGEYRWLESYALPRFNSTGEFLGYVGSSFDITEIKEAETALRLSENRYRTLANAVSQLMWVNEPNGNIQFFNQRWQEYTGKSDLELGVGLWVDVIHPDDFQHTLDVRTTAIAANESYEVECRLKQFDQTYRWHLARIVPLKNEQGQVLYWFGTATDIHNQKQIEYTQRLLAQASKTFAAASLDLQAVLDSTTRLIGELIGDLCILSLLSDDGQWLETASLYHANPDAQSRMVELLQTYPRRAHEGFAGQVIQTGTPLRLPAVTPQDVQAYLSSNYAAYADHVGIYSVLVVPLTLQGQTIGTLGICRDRPDNPYSADDQHLLQDLADRAVMAIANAKLYAAEQRARAEAEAANRIKDEFLAVLSHELRSPLNPILGWSRLLQTRTFDPEATQRALETIERNAKLQTQLIEDLLDVSRILRGKTVLNVSTVNLIPIIQSALETVRLAADAKDIQIQTHFAINTATVLGDSTRLQQIVWNLLSNAIKFTPDGGQVEIWLEPIWALEETVETSASSLAQIRVTDTGKGISPEFLPYVFEYFRQEDGKTTRKFGGLGLGLAIVRYLTELHGGTVKAESAGDGQGATFIVQIPMLAAHATSAPHPTDLTAPPSALAPQFPLNEIRVLMVDDDADMRDLMVAILERSGATVTLAASAPEALALMSSWHPDILISDIGMPDVDGYMLIQQLRSRSPEQGGQIPAIALTAYAGGANHQQALAAGFQIHLSKPVEPDVLIRAIAELTM